MLLGFEYGFNSWKEIIETIVAFFTLLSIVGGAFFALKRWSADQKIRTASCFNELVLRFQSPEISQVFYLIDDARYGGKADEKCKAWFCGLFSCPEKESALDALLTFLSYICYLEKQGLAGSTVTKYFRYPLDAVLSCPGVQSYLKLGLSSQGEDNPYHLLIVRAREKGIQL